jgi:hypothetical protein
MPIEIRIIIPYYGTIFPSDEKYNEAIMFLVPTDLFLHTVIYVANETSYILYFM